MTCRDYGEWLAHQAGEGIELPAVQPPDWGLLGDSERLERISESLEQANKMPFNKKKQNIHHEK